MARSTTVATTDWVLASQYNYLREDILSTTYGHTHSGSTDEGRALAANSVGSTQLAANAIKTTHITDSNVTEAKIADGAVTVNKIGSAAVTLPKMASSSVGSAQIVNSAVIAGKIGAAAVDSTNIAADAVNDTLVGSRVPQFYRRQGGDASNWSTYGTTNYTPGMVRMQAGVIEKSGTPSDVTIIFPVAFSQPPIMFATLEYTSLGGYIGVLIDTVWAGSVKFLFFASHITANYIVHWVAIGPE